MSSLFRRRIAAILFAILVISLGVFAWYRLQTPALPAGFASGNGRIEAIEVNIATKSAGRIKEVLVQEGDFVEPGQVVARMDTQALEAEYNQMRAKVRQSENASSTADAITLQRLEARASAASQLAQRRQAKATALAAVAQYESEVSFAQSELQRSEDLVAKGFITRQRLEADKTKLQSAQAALEAARSRVAEAQAAIDASQSQVQEAQSAIAASRSQVKESQSSIDAAMAAAEKIRADIDDATLKAPVGGRIQYRLAEPGEVLSAGGRILGLLDITDVYMTFFLPETVAGRVAIGSETRLVLDAAPQYVIPARISFVASEAQFTPKTVETTTERQKLMFRVKARIDPALLRKYKTQVKTGLPGTAYVQIDPTADWPAYLQVKLP